MIEHHIYRVQDHWSQNYLLSPVTGQLLKGISCENWDEILARNLWSQIRHGIEAARPVNHCRYPPIHDLLTTPRGFYGRSSTFRQWWNSLLRAWLTPEVISTWLGRQRVVGGGLAPALEAIGRLAPLPRGQCFIKSYQEARILRRHGVNFSLLYGLIVPSNLMHAWVEIPAGAGSALLIDEFPGMVQSFQVSIELQVES